MGKILFYGLVCILLSSCNERKTSNEPKETAAAFFSVDSLPKPFTVNSKAATILKDWKEFNDLENAFMTLYNVDNREDLVLVIEDLIEKQKALEASDYPETFDKPQIKSRQKVFKTFVLKTKGNLEYREGVKSSTMEMIQAYNAYRGQFNVLVNSVLDTSLISTN